MAAVVQNLSTLPKHASSNNGPFTTTQFVRSLQFFYRADYVFVCGVKFNGVRMGNTTGGNVFVSEELFLDANEYIKSLDLIYSNNSEKDDLIRYLKVTTTKGRSVAVGSASGAVKSIPSPSDTNGLNAGSVVLELSFFIGKTEGKDTDFLAFIEGKCCNINNADGSSTTSIVSSRKLCVIGIAAPNTSMKIHTSSTVSRMSAMSKMMERQFDSSFSASVTSSASARVGVVKMNMSAQVAFNTNLSTTESTSIRQELDEQVTNATTETREVPEGFVGLEVVSVDIYEDTYGTANEAVTWMWPTSQVEYILVKLTDGITEVGVYDLTGALSAQVPVMASRKDENHEGLGFDWYKKAE